MASSVIVFTLIGDLVASRSATSRASVQDAVGEALARVAEMVPPLDRLEPTVGDEFQGAFGSFADAALAALLLRLHLLPHIDSRYGLGVGEREVLEADRRPMLQDGPAWWSARQAIDELGRPGRRTARTWYDASQAPQGEGAGVPDAGLANAFLLCRDQVVDRLSERGCRMLLLSLEGATQRDIAAAEGISKSAVSQQFARGIQAVKEAQTMLGGVT
ncbi:SatD family protein [Nocardioides pacificus]